MQRFHGALGAEVAASGAKIKIVQMPDDRWPRIVQHPLNHACGLILVAAVGLIHRPHTFICLKLRLEREIFCAVCLAIARIQSVGEYVNIFERATTRVIVPEIVNWPEMVFRQHCAHALDRWNRDRKSTRLNSSHLVISYAVFCLKKKIK